jgi:hypothetical protein
VCHTLVGFRCSSPYEYESYLHSVQLYLTHHRQCQTLRGVGADPLLAKVPSCEFDGSLDRTSRGCARVHAVWFDVGSDRQSRTFRLSRRILGEVCTPSVATSSVSLLMDTVHVLYVIFGTYT